MAEPQRKPVLYKPAANSDVQVLQDEPNPTKVINLNQEVKEIQQMSTVSAGTSMRRLLFIWLRVYVLETKYGKSQRVNVRIPIPIPLIGATFQRQLSFQKAAKVSAAARRGEDISELLDSAMGFEFVRVEESHPERGKSQLVVVGLD